MSTSHKPNPVPLRRLRCAVAGLLLVTLLASGCGAQDGDDPVSDDKTTTATPPSSKSMDQAVADMQRMRAEMTTALEKKYGPPRWGLASNQQPFIERSACDGDSNPSGELAYLPNWATKRAYDTETWQRAAALVRDVGRRFGFDRVETVVDLRSKFEIDGRSPDGGQYIFDLTDRSAGLLITTGCYVWNDMPQGTPPDAPSR